MRALLPGLLVAAALCVATSAGAGSRAARRVREVLGEPRAQRLRAAPATAAVPVLALCVGVMAGPAAASAALVLAWLTVLWHRTGKARRRSARIRGELVELVTALAAELRAGRPAPEALRLAATDAPADVAELLAVPLRSAAYGGDVATALLAAAATPGAAALRALAAAWRVSAETGASLAGLADRIAQALRREEQQRRLVAAQLAGPRASAQLLAALPVVGLALGAAVGASPTRTLLHTPWGLACLILAIGLDLLGLWWVDRLVRRAEAA